MRQTDGDINAAAVPSGGVEDDEAPDKDEEEVFLPSKSAKNFLAFTTIDAGAISNNSGTSSVSMYTPFVLSPFLPLASWSYFFPRKRTVAPTLMRFITFGSVTFK